MTIPAYNNKTNSIIQQTADFLETGCKNSLGTQTTVHNSSPTYHLSMLDDSINARKESLCQSIMEQQRELEQLQNGHIPGWPSALYANTNI